MVGDLTRRMTRPAPVGFLSVATGLLAALAVTAAGLVAPAAAAANVVSYVGTGVNVKSGQTRGLPVYVTFQLIGKGCPKGPECLDHAKVQALGSVDWAYPDCPEVLDGSFELDKHQPQRVSPHSPHEFSASGISELYPGTHVAISGGFSSSGTARGWLAVDEDPCSTGRIHWVAHPD
jgi:hypothetical protein